MLTRILPLAVLAATLTLPMPAALAQAEADSRTPEQRLDDARRRLEAAAREVAELSGEVHGPRAMERFEIRLGGPPRAMLGVIIGESDPAQKGVRVESVSPGGPAAAAGVRAADVIIAIDGKSVGTGRELVRVMQDVKPGQKIKLDLRREGRPLQVEIEARAVESGPFGGPHMGAMLLPDWDRMHAGHEEHWLLGGWGDAELVTLTPGLGRYFGADQGVLVVRAPAGAGELKEGDVILAIGGREPQNAPHAMRILRSYQPGETVELRILRDRKTRNVSLAVPEHPGHDRMHHRMGPVPPIPPMPQGADRT